MEAFHERLMVRAATVDELLSDAFEALPGQRGDADLAARRLAAWCRACASGDWSLFERRLERDGLSVGRVLAAFATVRRKASVPPPAWIADAIWIEASLQGAGPSVEPPGAAAEPVPVAFAHLLLPVAERAQALVRASIEPLAADALGEAGMACLAGALLREMSGLLAPALYERFTRQRKAATSAAGEPPSEGATTFYGQFVAEMRAGGFRRLFDEKPVLLRLVATLVRQWIETAREFATRLGTDLPEIRTTLFGSRALGALVRVEGGLSDPHNLGRTVQIVRFEDGSRLVYKPKDQRVDEAWRALVERLNRSGAPVELKAARIMARDGYGWTEFVAHSGCADAEGLPLFFRRTGAWLALFHGFASTDMHQENMIAAGDHPVPIDLEMILQATPEEQEAGDPELLAFEAAADKVANSVMMVGLLPAYVKSPGNNILAIGGLTSNWTSGAKLTWSAVNTDAMQPRRVDEGGRANPNLPHRDGRYARLSDHVDDLVEGFEDYAQFLSRLNADTNEPSPFDGFCNVAVRKIVRPTRYYALLLQRLRDYRNMEDGMIWSTQADFAARLSDWDKANDSLWPLQRSERAALIALNVPHFVLPSDGTTVSDATGTSVDIKAVTGLERAQARLCGLDAQDIAWQTEVIRQHTGRSASTPTPAGADRAQLSPTGLAQPTREALVARADAIADILSREAVRKGPGAAWIGLDWLGDATVSQLMPLGAALYNGTSGIALFLAAHGTVARRAASTELAVAAIAALRKTLKSRNVARMARALGIGGSMGMGSIVYALTVIAALLRDESLLNDARAAAELISDELIGADKQLDVMGGSAGAILGLLRLHRQSGCEDALRRATKCGEHLLALPRIGPPGAQSWAVPGAGPQPLNGMSHGAAGFALALASLAKASGRETFAHAAAECIAFEDQSYDTGHENWPDAFDDTGPLWRCRWCHGGVGIGLSRLAMRHCEAVDAAVMAADVERALAGAERGWPGPSDTLCCGSLGSIELAREAARTLERRDLQELAARRLAAVLDEAASSGGYRWTMGRSRFNLGLFRGLAGVGYTIVRQIDAGLPNVLIWE